MKSLKWDGLTTLIEPHWLIGVSDQNIDWLITSNAMVNAIRTEREQMLMIHSPHKPICHRRRGAAAVEMALVTPIFLMLVFGIIEFGRGMMVSNMVTNAAREGARMAVLDGSTNAEVTASVQAFLNSALGLAPSNVTVTISTVPDSGNPDPANVIANCQPGDSITVQVQVPFNKVALVPGNYLAGKVLSGQSTMRHE